MRHQPRLVHQRHRRWAESGTIDFNFFLGTIVVERLLPRLVDGVRTFLAPLLL